MLTKLAGWALVAFAAWYLLTDPAGATGVVLGILHGLRSAASSLSSFASHL
jgi:hypothetical protein